MVSDEADTDVHWGGPGPCGRYAHLPRRRSQMTKFIFVTGGVVSSIGKGITAASIGRLLRDRGLKVSLQKIDPYLNVDAGTMNPFQHGEVFVLDDGAETDLDLGHYERFVDVSLTGESNLTTGQVYGAVIRKERAGSFLGKTVQVIPHITDEIKRRILSVPERIGAEVAIVEIGGTVGDIESLPFLEAIRQIKNDIGPENAMYVHVTLIPFVGPRGEAKTKPTQHSTRELRSIGIQPDLLVCRTKSPLTNEMIEKISLFCDVPKRAVIEGRDTHEIYQIPSLFEEQGLAELICGRFSLPMDPTDNEEWEGVMKALKAADGEVKVALVGKYVDLRDAYLSVMEALKHGGLANGCHVDLHWVDSEAVQEQGAEKYLGEVDGVIVPGGFGHRGIEGKVEAIKHARETGLPFFGLCLGLQCAVVEFSRNVCGLKEANSSEFDSATPFPVIDLMESQRGVEDKGGSMRLGGYECRLDPSSTARRAYLQDTVSERHRHRYEVNNRFRDQLEKGGLRLSGISPDGELVEIVELTGLPFFVATQFHPEFKSRPNRAHPLFREFIGSCLNRARGVAG